MTNIENTPSPEFDGNHFEVAEFVDTEPTFTADLSVLTTPYRYLAWVSSKASKLFSVDLTDYSPERQAAVAAFVDRGLVSERKWTGGDLDGRVSYRVTPVGQLALEVARAAADLTLLG
jgi:hypothetical protein